MTSTTWSSPRYVQELTTIWGPQNRIQGSCGYKMKNAIKKRTIFYVIYAKCFSYPSLYFHSMLNYCLYCPLTYLTSCGLMGPTFHSSNPHFHSSSQTCKQCFELRVQYSDMTPNRVWRGPQTFFNTHGNHFPLLSEVHGFKDFLCSVHFLVSFDGRIYSLKHFHNCKFVHQRIQQVEHYRENP